jgi:uncharacterized membrane protein
MAFCKNCGSPVEGQFCGKCGTPLAAGPAPGGYAPPPPPPQQPPQYGQQPYQQQPPYGGQQQYGAAPQSAPVATGGLQPNVAGLLCYVVGFITGIVFLAIAPYNQNKFVRFHAWQSIFLNIAWFAFWILEMIVSTVLLTVSFAFSALLGLLSLVISLAFLVLWVMLMVKAYQGQKWVLPIIGPLAEKQA